MLRLRGRLDVAEVKPAEHAIDGDRRHFRDPAAEQHGKRRAGEKAQAGIERDLVETQNQRAGEREPRQHAAAEEGARALIQQNHDDAVGKQDQRAPHHQRAHLVEEGEIGVAVRRQHLGAVMARQEGQRKQQQVADQKPVDRLAHHHRILADIDQEQQHQLAGEQHRRAWRGDDAERQGDVEDAGEIGFEEVHHA